MSNCFSWFRNNSVCGGVPGSPGCDQRKGGTGSANSFVSLLAMLIIEMLEMLLKAMLLPEKQIGVE